MARYDLTRFRASHNSYSGDKRGSIERQLNAGVRCLEFDFHDNNFATFMDYRIGHLKPGAEVDHALPNPADSLLASWLKVIDDWSQGHPGHEPITLILDAKDDLTDNDEGDLGDLNHSLVTAFGGRLFTREAFDLHGGWPDTSDLRDHVICVLSGSGTSRAAYRWAFGTTPAVAANAGGDVVLAYRSTAAEINCWRGDIDAGEVAVNWRRKHSLAASDIDLGEPALGMNDDRWVVAVYRFGPRPGLHGRMLTSKLGFLRDDGTINWWDTQVVDDGWMPSLNVNGNDIHLIYRAASGSSRRLRTGVIDRTRRAIAWKKAKETTRAPFPCNVAAWGTHSISVGLDHLGAVGCVVDSGVLQPVRFPQVLFVECQKGEDPALFRDAPFFGAGAANQSEIAAARRKGLVARAWGFTEADKTQPPSPPQENLPATDAPHTAWYRNYV